MQQQTLESCKWAFMGTAQIAVDFLNTVAESGIYPHMIVTNPPQVVGRTRAIEPSPVNRWADRHGIECSTHKPEELVDVLATCDFVCVFAYGALLPRSVLDAPRWGVLNIHPSLLPEYRGPSPITTAILHDHKHTGVSLMQLVPQMDAGPIIAQTEITIPQWRKYYLHEQEMAHLGAELFTGKMNQFLQGQVIPQKQNHERATFCPKYNKQDMEIHRQANEYQQYRTYCAFPKPFFINSRGSRIVITQASFTNNQFIIERIIPEGKREQDYRAQWE